jgi:hypothetical protein
MWKRRLSIFLLLAILVASVNWEPASVKSAAPIQVFLPYVRNTGPVVISESECIYDKGGMAGVVGNVMNISNRTVYDVKIQVDIFYDNGQVISGTGHTVFTPTVSLQRNPFYIGPREGIYNNMSDCKSKILSWTRESKSDFLPLTIDYSATDIPGTVSVSFRNDNPVPLKNVILYTWFLHQYLPIDGYPRTEIESVAPGETISNTGYLLSNYVPNYVLGMGSADP